MGRPFFVARIWKANQGESLRTFPPEARKVKQSPKRIAMPFGDCFGPASAQAEAGLAMTFPAGPFFEVAFGFHCELPEFSKFCTFDKSFN